jgi:AcrR family transcriptional regulator
MARLTNLSERGLETRRLLRDVLLALAIEKGYDKVTISDITARAEIDRSTFYLHYKDKDELFEASRRAVIDEIIELRKQGTGPFPGIPLTFEHMAKNPALYLVILQTETGAADRGGFLEYLASSMEPILAKALEERRRSLPGGVSAVSRYLTGAFAGLARWWLESGVPEPPARVSTLFIELARGGLQSLVNNTGGQEPSNESRGEAR